MNAHIDDGFRNLVSKNKIYLGIYELIVDHHLYNIFFDELISYYGTGYNWYKKE